MMIKTAACLLALSFLTACQSTTTTAKRETVRDITSRYASNPSATSSTQPAPVAEGPEDVPSDRPMDPTQDPALVPSPLLRTSAIGGL